MLPFEVSSTTTLFQRTMEKILQGLEHVAVYIEDILITGSSEEEHLKTGSHEIRMSWNAVKETQVSVLTSQR